MRVASFSRGITGTVHLSITHEPRLYVFAQLHVFFSICWVRPLLSPPPPPQPPRSRAQRDSSTITSLFLQVERCSRSLQRYAGVDLTDVAAQCRHVLCEGTPTRLHLLSGHCCPSVAPLSSHRVSFRLWVP